MNPLEQALRNVIDVQGPLTPDRLRQALRRAGTNVPVDAIERQMKASPQLFRPTGSGHWDLAENHAPIAVPARQTLDHVDPLINGGLDSDFVMVDIETTGTSLADDEIVQIAAVRVRSGIPVAAFNRYVRTVSAVVTPALRLRMRWGELPDDNLVDCAIAVRDLQMFVGGDSVVAWNADFDMGFIDKAGWNADRVVDALAMALLALPVGPHRLEEVARRLGVISQPIGQLALDGPTPSSDHLHDALVDCLLTVRIHREVVLRLSSGVSGDVVVLLPELPLVALEGDELTVLSTPPTTELSGESAEELLAEIVAATGRQVRPAQHEAAVLAGKAMNGSSALVEAPTGTGKTLAYLAAALAVARKGHRVALVTAFKNLQDQLLDEIADVSGLVDVGIQVAVLKGAGNYFCIRRLERLRDELPPDALGLRFVVAVLFSLIQERPLATRDDVPGWLLHRVPGAQSIVEDTAVACGHQECGRSLAIDAANAADVVVMNQVLWVSPPDDLTPAPLVVIDEAHDLEEMATLALTEEIGSAQLLALANRLDPPGRRGLLSAVRHAGGHVDAATQLVQRLKSTTQGVRLPLGDFARSLVPDVDDETGGSVRLRRAPAVMHPAAWTRTADLLRDLHDTLRRLASEISDLSANGALDDLTRDDLVFLAMQVNEYEELLWRIPAVRETALVHFFELEPLDQGGWRFARSPVEVAPLLQEKWASLNGFVLLSATLQTGGNDFGFVVDRLGLRGHIPGGAQALDSDFDFKENVVLGLARWFDSIPVPRFMPEFERETAEELRSMAEFGDGRMLALFTASSRLRKAAAEVAEPLATRGIPVLAQGDGSRAALLDEFRARSESVLLGTRSFWQGVDVPGASLSFVEIEKLPFPHMRDPVTEARTELLRRQARNEFSEYLLPSMTIALKQGFGRLVRTATDRGAVIILDRRLHAKPYRDMVLASLPGFRTRNLDVELSRRAFYSYIDASLPGLISPEGRAFVTRMDPATSQGSSDLPLVPRVGERALRRPTVIAAIRDTFGFEGFRSSEQEELFWRIHDGEDVIGILPTGAGKSLPFQLSALVGDGITVVVSPLVALMRDQVENLLDRGIRQVGALVGQMTADERDEVIRRVSNGTISLLYIAPERLRDPLFLEHLRSFDLRRVVVDEAHCVSLWGPSFRPDFLAIRSSLDHAGHDEVPIAALTATATPEIEGEIREALGIEAAETISTPAARPNLRLAVLGNDPRIPGDRFANSKDRVRHLVRILTAATRRSEAAIVYVPTVASSEQVATQLQQSGVLARAYHGRLDAWSRQNVEELFREGEVDVVVATKAFGMGIDRADVRYVIHLGCPADLESYYQEAGRAGRDGAPSWCLLMPLVSSDQRTQQWFIEQVAELDQPLADAAAYFTSLGPGSHLVDLEELAERLGLEETQSRVVLHYLEAGGIVDRSANQTSLASVLLLEEPLDPIVRSVCGIAAMLQMVPTPLGMVAAADGASMEVRDLERRFIAESRAGRLVYRAVRQAASIRVLGEAVQTMPSTAAVTGQMYKKLDQMLGFATERERCRQMTIRMYLGEEPQSVERCGICDVCDPALPRPWLDVPLDLVPAADRLVDAELTCLYAVQWNEAEVAAGRAPYGRAALRSLVAGDRFQLGRYTEGAERSRRIRRAEASPYWGSLSLMTNPSEKVRAAFDVLDAEGCLTARQFEVINDRGSGLERYSYPALTALGVRRLELGLVAS